MKINKLWIDLRKEESDKRAEARAEADKEKRKVKEKEIEKIFKYCDNLVLQELEKLLTKEQFINNKETMYESSIEDNEVRYKIRLEMGKYDCGNCIKYSDYKRVFNLIDIKYSIYLENKKLNEILK